MSVFLGRPFVFIPLDVKVDHWAPYSVFAMLGILCVRYVCVCDHPD